MFHLSQQLTKRRAVILLGAFCILFLLFVACMVAVLRLEKIPSTLPQISGLPIAPSSVTTSTDPSIPQQQKGLNPESPTPSSALRDLFGLSATDTLRPEAQCVKEEILLSEFPSFFSHGIRKTFFIQDGRRLDVFIRTPDETLDHTAVAQAGLDILQKIVPEYEQMFSSYPCPQLFVNAFSDKAIGSPGYLIIGGKQGLDSWLLLGHEFTHSYFHSSMSASWFAEGAAQFLPYMYMHRLQERGVVSPKDLYGDYATFDFTFDQFVDREIRAWSISAYDSAGITRTARICDVQDHYLQRSAVGLLFMVDIYRHLGQARYLQVMSTIYLHYRLTQEPNSPEDILRVITYFSPDRSSPFLEEIARRLCL